MAEHALTTPVTLARRRHVREAPGASDRRWSAGSTKTLVVRLSRTEDDGLPRGFDLADGFATPPGQPAFSPLLRWTGAITPDFRRRIEHDIELLIGLLDALDAAVEDLEADEDCCEAADDDPASSHPIVRGAVSTSGPGDPTDGENTPEDEGEPSDDDLPYRQPPAATFRRFSTACSNAPFHLDSSAHAAVRCWRTGRPA